MIAGIVLAAGMSVRMGTLKQLLPLGSKTVIEVVVEGVRSRLEQVFVVLGHRADQIVPVLVDHPVELVINSDYRSGMLSSVKCGIRAAGPATAYLICLGDQPGLDPGVIGEVIEAAAASGKGIVIPTYEGQRGHPILIDRSYRGEILALAEDRGLNTITRGHPGDTLEVPISGRAVVEDMDTPADYGREQARNHSGPR